MDIQWNELPKNAACVVTHSDFSGMDFCYIDSLDGLCKFDGGEPVDLSEVQLVAINPSVSLKDFGESMFIANNKHIRDQINIIDELKERVNNLTSTTNN